MALGFDQSMQLIRTSAGASQTEVDQMSASILNLVSSGQSYGQSAAKMAHAPRFEITRPPGRR